MRKTIFALATSALIASAVFVGCGSDPVDVGDMLSKTDGPVTTTGDMAVPKLTCGELIECISSCDGGSDFATCRANCEKKSKNGSPKKFSDALGCGQAYCLGTPDAGNGKCLIDEVAMQLVNLDGSAIDDTDPGTGQKACGACLNNSLAGLFGGTCEPANSPDCNPASCTTITNACLNET